MSGDDVGFVNVIETASDCCRQEYYIPFYKLFRMFRYLIAFQEPFHVCYA